MLKMAPPFLSRLPTDKPLAASLSPVKESGCVTLFKGGVYGKLVFHDSYPAIGEEFLRRGLGHRVPYIGHIRDGPRITVLTREISGPDLEYSLTYGGEKSEQKRIELWFEYGVLEGEFHRNNAIVHYGSNNYRTRNYISEDGGILQMFDIDSRSTFFRNPLSDDEREKVLESNLNWVGDQMNKKDYTAFIHGYIAGFINEAVSSSHKAVDDAIKRFENAWKSSPGFLRDVFNSIGL